MTGEQLLKCLQAMKPEQLKLDVFTRVEDVGRWRETVYNPCESIDVWGIDADDEEVEGLVIS